MRSRWVSLAVAVLVAAPVPGGAQQVKELGLQAIGAASDPGFLGAGVYGAWRPSHRARLSVGVAVGGMDGETAWRGEVLGHFLLTPRIRRGVGVYGAAGVAVVGGPIEEGYVVLTLGVERSPGSRSGWFAEAGFGGGARGAVGLRRRWF